MDSKTLSVRFCQGMEAMTRIRKFPDWGGNGFGGGGNDMKIEAMLEALKNRRSGGIGGGRWM